MISRTFGVDSSAKPKKKTTDAATTAEGEVEEDVPIEVVQTEVNDDDASTGIVP